MSIVYVKNVVTLDDELTGAGGGTPRVNLEVTIRKMPTIAFVNGGTVEKNKGQTIVTDTTGLWQIPLQPNGEITIPAGSYYTAREGRDGAVLSFVVPPISDPRVTLNGTTGHYEAWFESLLVLTPSDPGALIDVVTADEMTAAILVETGRAETAETLRVPYTGIPTSDLTAFNVYLPEAHGAIGDGSHDDTTALQAALTAVPNGARVYLSRTYKTTGQVNLTSKTGVEICGPGKINYTDTATSVGGVVFALQLLSCIDCKVIGPEVDVITQSQQYNGIQVTSCTHTEIKATVRNARWVGVAVDGVVGQVGQSRDTKIHHCTVEYCRFGIADEGIGTTIESNFIADYWLSSTEAQAGPWQSSSLYYDGILVLSTAVESKVLFNHIFEVGQSGVYATAGNATVIGNKAIRPQNWGVDFGPGSTITGVTVVGNEVIDAAAGSINFFKVNASTIVGNTCTNTGTSYFGAPIDKVGIALNSSSSYNTISGNTVSLPVGATSPAFFANTAAPKAIGNKFIGNNPAQSPVPYTMNFTDNTVIDTGQAVQWGVTGVSALNSTGLVTVDLSAQSGFAGRNAVNLIPSSDNTFAQFVCNATSGLKFLTSGGVGIPITAGQITGTGLSVSGTAFFNNQRVTSVGTPTSSTDAANKAYVDAVASGLSPKSSVAAIATANITLSGTQTIDGIAVTAGKRVLAVGQSTASQNGLWVVASGAWTRPTDFASASVQAGSYAFVDGGTANANSGWVLAGDAVTVDTTAQTWTQFSGAGEITAGSGLAKAGNTLSIENSGVLLPAHGGTGAASLSGLRKANGSSADTAAISGTDFAPATSGSSLLKASSGGFANATASDIPVDTTATDIKPVGTQAAGAVGKAADAGHVHPGGTAIVTSTNTTWPIPTGATLLEVVTVGGGGQGGGGGSAAAAQLQAGGGGGSAGASSTQIVSVGSNTTLNVQIGTGGSAAGAGGALGGNAGGTGSNGTATTVTGTGISVFGGGGTGGGGSSASSTTGGLGAVYGSGGFRGTTVNAGSGAVGGGFSGQPTDHSPGGGGGGGAASATLGGGGGGAGVFSGQSSPGGSGSSGTAAGVVGVAGAANSGSGGGGGGGGAAGTGAGGTGGAGGSGFVIIKVIG